MAVESGERWNGWLVLTHCLIYPQCPCEHSGGIHYLTSSITSYGQGKRSAFHASTHPRDLLRGFSQRGDGMCNVVAHIKQKCLSWGRGSSRRAVQEVAQHIAHNTQHIARDHMHAHFMGQGNWCIRYFPHRRGVFVLNLWVDKCRFYESDEAGGYHMREQQ